jgi:hypothetical protein
MYVLSYPPIQNRASTTASAAKKKNYENFQFYHHEDYKTFNLTMVKVFREGMSL